tara:strand:+ start:362 stop:679 length:318 start_codon:yes stop_codon:yes gene_type:complete
MSSLKAIMPTKDSLFFVNLEGDKKGRGLAKDEIAYAAERIYYRLSESDHDPTQFKTYNSRTVTCGKKKYKVFAKNEGNEYSFWYRNEETKATKKIYLFRNTSFSK